VAVASVVDFKVADDVRIWDNTPTTETCVIASIAGNTLTMETNLTNAYQVADGALVRRLAKWDIEKCGSENTIPYVGFYFQKNATVTNAYIKLFTTDHLNDFFHIDDVQGLGSGGSGVWDYFRFPIGPYWSLSEENVQFRWGENGSPDWSEINGISFWCNGSGVGTSTMYIDDLHITGKIIREASDTSELAAQDEYQRVIVNTRAVDDTLKASDDSGLAARLVYAELLRRAQTPIVGMIQIPMAVDLLPGQTVHIHACQKSDNTYRIDKDMRVKELRHVIGQGAPYGGFATILNLTDDVTNTHAFAVPTQQSLFLQYAGALGHAVARIRQLDIGEEDKEKILWKNAAKLLKL